MMPLRKISYVAWKWIKKSSSGSCIVAGFGIRIADPVTSAATVLVYGKFKIYIQLYVSFQIAHVK
jgi:hypothetical protein